MKDNLIGMKFNRLTVIEKSAERRKNGAVKWVCKCECGNTKVVEGYKLKSGHTQSCGCLRSEMTVEKNKKNAKHGMHGTKIYGIWRHMKERTTKTTHKQYQDYGGRGIRVCDEWSDFSKFYEWSIANGYKEGLSIDRADNDGNYEPSNCRWTDDKTQANNRRNNHLIEYEGKKQTMKQWADEKGIDYGLVKNRMRAGMPLEKVFYKGRLKKESKKTRA